MQETTLASMNLASGSQRFGSSLLSWYTPQPLSPASFPWGDLCNEFVHVGCPSQGTSEDGVDQVQPQSRNIPMPLLRSTSTHMLPVTHGEADLSPLVTTRNGTWRTVDGRPRPPCSSQARGGDPICPLCRWFEGPRYPGRHLPTCSTVGSGLSPSHPPQMLPGPAAAWTWLGCSLSRTASLSRRATSSCSWAFSSRSWDMASTILCTTGAAPGSLPSGSSTSTRAAHP